MYYDYNNPKPGCVYCIECKVNNRRYIGQTRNFNKRILTHKNMLKNNTHTNKSLQSDFNKYGINNFIFYIIESNLYYDNLINQETFWINYYGGIESTKTYNMQDLTNINKQVKNYIGNANSRES